MLVQVNWLGVLKYTIIFYSRYFVTCKEQVPPGEHGKAALLGLGYTSGQYAGFHFET